MANVKETARGLKREWKRQQEAAARAALPLEFPRLASLFEHVEAELARHSCDHSLRFACGWLEHNGSATEAESVLRWLRDNGGYCDCEVVANVEWKPGAELCPGDCLAFPLPSRKYGAAVVVARHSAPGGDQVVVVVSRLAVDRPPRLQQVAAADVLIINYDGLLYPAREIYVLQAASYSMCNVPFMRIGHLQIARAFKPSDYVQAGAGWDGIPDTVHRQLEWERDCPGPSERLSLATLLADH